MILGVGINRFQKGKAKITSEQQPKGREEKVFGLGTALITWGTKDPGGWWRRIIIRVMTKKLKNDRTVS